MSTPEHPDDETLRRFILGRLDRATMARVEGHLRACPLCVRVAKRVPDDGFVGLLRRPEAYARHS
jgi:hypothetical protein